MEWRSGSTVCAEPYLRSGALVILDGPSFPQSAYRIHCDLRSYDDDQVRRVYDWFIREAGTGARLCAECHRLESLIDLVNISLLILWPPAKYSSVPGFHLR